MCHRRQTLLIGNLRSSQRAEVNYIQPSFHFPFVLVAELRVSGIGSSLSQLLRSEAGIGR